MSRLVFACLLAITPGCWNANLRAASSGEIGCPESEITISEDSGGGSGSRTWIAECRDRTFYCSALAVTEQSAQYSCTESADSEESGASTSSTSTAVSAGPSAQPVSKYLPPKEAVGFSLSASQESAEQSCVGAGHEWAPKQDAFTCSGTPVSVANDARARLAFCGEKLCDLTVFVSFDGADKEADAQLLSILKALKEKYGDPAKHETDGTAECRAQGMVSCSASGAGFLTREWAWTSGEQIFLALKGKEGKATLAVRYLTQKKPAPGASAF